MRAIRYRLLIENGNGRLVRLLAAYAGMANGVPFPMHLSNGHSKVRQHYQQVLRYADRRGGTTARVEAFVLECLDVQWQNAIAFTKRQTSSVKTGQGGGRTRRAPMTPGRPRARA